MPEQLAQLETGYYVYGVVPALEGAARSVLRGIDDTKVEFIDHGEVSAAVAHIALDRPPGRRAELMAHSAVVDALAGVGPVVPVQFGSVLADGGSVVDDLLARDHDFYADLLGRLRGTHQYRLQGTYVRDQVLADLVRMRPDIAALRDRTRHLPDGTMHPDLVRLGELVAAAVDALRDEDAAMVLDVVHPLVVATHLRPAGGIDKILDAGLLVADARVHEIEAELESLAEAVHDRIRLSLSGPMAPYDFVEGEQWA